MKRIIENLTIGAAGLILVAALASVTGCVTSKRQVVTNGVTNTVVVVNEANLAFDAAGLQAATAVAVNAVLARDPSAVGPLKTAQTVLAGVLNGTSPQTTAQVIALLKAQNNSALNQEMTTLVGEISALEQKLLAQYGATVAGEISVALTKAVYSGLTVGLAGH